MKVCLEKTEGGDYTRWSWVFIDGDKVMKGIGCSPYPGHEEEKVTSRYSVKNPSKLLEKLKSQGYE